MRFFGCCKAELPERVERAREAGSMCRGPLPTIDNYHREGSGNAGISRGPRE